jgi:hypothetical protein
LTSEKAFALLIRPVVLGSLYNLTHVTPEPLPQRLTRSGIRTQSSPGGGGFNEISFEDQTGLERIYVHAQKDMEEVIQDGHMLNVKNTQAVFFDPLATGHPPTGPMLIFPTLLDAGLDP